MHTWTVGGGLCRTNFILLFRKDRMKHVCLGSLVAYNHEQPVFWKPILTVKQYSLTYIISFKPITNILDHKTNDVIVQIINKELFSQHLN